MTLCFLIGFALDILVSWSRLQDVARGELVGPDSYMRLVRLDAILAAHAPLHAVMRDSSGGGTVLAWSHLLDSLLLLLAAPLACAIGWHDALRWAGVAAAPVEMGLLSAAAVWAFAPLTAPAWRWTTPVVAATAPPVVSYGMLGVIHHHTLLALACVMVAGWAGRGIRDGALAGWQAGIWAAIGLWLSPETMPFTLIAFAALSVAWLAGAPGDPALRALRAGAVALLALVAVILAVDPPAGGWRVPEVDRISIVYVWMALALCGLGLALSALDRLGLPYRARIALGGAAAAALLGVWVAGNPGVALGPGGLPDPEDTQVMFSGIAEMQPVTGWRDGALIMTGGALGAAILVARVIRRPMPLWVFAVASALAIVALGAVHRRFAIYGAVLGAGILPLAITLSEHRFAGRPPLIGSLDRMTLLALFLLPPCAAMLASGGAEAARPQRACAVSGAAAMLAPYAGQVVLADVNDTPELLYRTGVLTVGSLYHRNAAAFMRLRAAWRSGGGQQAPDAVVATGAAAILACPGQGRGALVSDLPDGTLLDRLDRDDPPGWLQRADGASSGAVLYRIVAPPAPLHAR